MTSEVMPGPPGPCYSAPTMPAISHTSRFGPLLREWRLARRFTQEVTAEELRVELYFPVDEASDTFLRSC